MNLGDVVVSKKTGYPASGTVAGMVVAPMYMAGRDQSYFSTWNELYPDWTEKPIVYVVFEEARRTVTFEEFIHYMPESMKNLDPKTLYETHIPTARIMAYPVDDLELL